MGRFSRLVHEGKGDEATKGRECEKKMIILQSINMQAWVLV